MNSPVATDVDRLHAQQERSLPACEPWSAAAVRLLQGVVYHDDPGDGWDAILAGATPLTDYFGRLGLLLIIDENDGLAYLRQPADDERPPDFEAVPKLFRTVRLGFDATLLCVLLRDELRRSEEEDLQNERCVIAQTDLLNLWSTFFPDGDTVRLNRTLTATLGKLEQLKFVRKFEKEPPSWEVRRILRARLPLATLKSLRESLEEELRRRGQSTDGDAAATGNSATTED